jgi:hypothetical protein
MRGIMIRQEEQSQDVSAPDTSALAELGAMGELATLDAALAYARAGWPVFPCNPTPDPPGTPAAKKKGKKPLVAGADKDEYGNKIPKTGGLWRATTDEKQIREWWGRRPKALIGVPTGERIGLFVLDIDPRGEDSCQQVLQRLIDAVGALPSGPISITQSGGWHLWFRNPSGEQLPKNNAARIPGVDWRGQGGYVIAPPSVMLDGKSYQWAPSPADIDFPEAPARLLDLIFQRGDFGIQPAKRAAAAAGPVSKPARLPQDAGDVAVRRYAQAALDRVRNDISTCLPGGRNNMINAAAYGIAPFVTLGALSEREVFAALQDGFDAWGLSGAGEFERFQETARRGFDAGRGNTAAMEAKFREIREEADRRGPRPRGDMRHSASPKAPEPPEPGHSPDEPEAPGGPDEPETAEGEPGESAGPVRPLGHNGGIYYYLSKAGEIRRLQDKDHKRLQILSLFDGDDQWLIEHCPAFDKDGNAREGVWSHDAAAKRLIRLAARQGLFDPNTPVRGPGVWRTGNGRLVVHAGNAIASLTADDCVELAEGGGLRWEHAGQVIDGGLYAATSRCQRPADEPARRSVGGKVLAALKLWCYDSPLSPDIILGFLGAAMLGGAPAWRVHLLLSAQGGSGKTWLMNFLDAALGGMGAYSNDASEAGLRQALTGESRVLLLDEAEGDEGSAGKVEAVIRLLRLMSSGSGANVMRGSAGGRAQSFQVTGCAVMAAILPPPLKPQDRSRICVINVLRPPSSQSTARAAEKAAAAIRDVRKVAPGLRTRAIAGWPRFQETFDLYRAGLIAKGLSGRNADTLATILSGRDLMLQDGVPDTDSIEADIEKFAPIMAIADEAEDEGEGQQCLTHLFTSAIDRWHQGEKSTVGELVMDRRNDILARVGLKIRNVDEGDGLLVANQHVGLARIFEGSKWSDGRWVTALRYLDGAGPFEKAVRMSGLLSRVSYIPPQHLPRRTDD